MFGKDMGRFEGLWFSATHPTTELALAEKVLGDHFKNKTYYPK